jgi:TatD DNase family protein
VFDIGVNLLNAQFDLDRQEVIDRAWAAGVHAMLLISTDIDETRKNQLESELEPNFFCTAGVHPHYAAQFTPEDLQQLELILTHHKVVAVGECGLDFNRDFSPRDRQIEVFELQLQLAKKANKAVYLHERDAFDTQLSLLKQYQIQQGVAHCFTGDLRQMRAYLELGLYIGITGWLCDERRHDQLVEALNYLPMDRLLIETDAPYLLPRTLQQKPKSRRNEPMYLAEIAQCIARLTGESVDKIQQISMQNSYRVFNLPQDLKHVD